MSVIKRTVLLYVLYWVFLSRAHFRCPEEVSVRRFYKIKSCRRSDAHVLSKGNARDVKECMSYAREKNGFAINYSPPDLSPEYFNCHVLACPENSNLTNLINDTAFDYYSSYGNLKALENSICLRNLGVFRLFQDKQNYSNAILKCQEYGADLANILTEVRTLALSSLINAQIREWYKAAYVGLDDRAKEGRFVTPLEEPISCYKYRAWSPGHPRNKHKRDDCVILDNDRTWKVVNCKIKLPFLCELYNEGPGRSNETFNLNCASIINDTDTERECRLAKKEIQFYKPSNDTSVERCYEYDDLN